MLVRTTLNVLLALAALILLGVLIGLSTASNDAQRRLDLSLRHMSDIAQSVEQEFVDMRNLNLDGRERLANLSEALESTLSGAGEDIELGYPRTPNTFQRLRTRMVEGFNALGGDDRAAMAPERVHDDFGRLRRDADRLMSAIDDYSQRYGEYQELSAAATRESRDFVRELRERRLEEQADMIFRSSQQLLQRMDGGSDAELAQVEPILTSLSQEVDLGVQSDRSRLDDLTRSFHALVPLRGALERSFREMAELQLTQRIEALRDAINRDYLYHLATVNDSRILLNVYTGLLLLVLGYFGVRLHSSYSALNQSYDELETVNASLEERVKERTEDLESAFNELQESQLQLVQAEKMSSLGQLVAGVMHEINTPLLYVLNNQSTTVRNIEDLKSCVAQAASVADVLRTPGATTQDLKRELQVLRERVESSGAMEAIEEIEALTGDNIDGLKQISELVQSLKDFSRLDRSHEDKFDVREGIEKTLTITHNLWKQGVEVVKEYEDVPEILCAPSKINQVLINVVTNAVQAMDGEGRLTIRTRSVGDWVEIDVEDTGCGISEENIAKIMDPFFTTKPVGEGTGLGMSIASKIIDEHGGRIEVFSEIDVGTRFTIKLPVRQESTAEAA